MKTFLIILCSGLLFFVTWSQRVLPDVSTLQEIGINNSDIETLLEMDQETRKFIRESSADLAVLKVEIRRELNNSSCVITQVERLTMESSKISSEMQLVKIRSSLDIRNLIG